MTNQDLSRRAFIHTAGKAGMVAGLTGSVLTSLANTNSGIPSSLLRIRFLINSDPFPMHMRHWNRRLMRRPWKFIIPNTQPPMQKIWRRQWKQKKWISSKVSLEDLLASISKYSYQDEKQCGWTL